VIEREPGADWRELQVRVAAILQESGLQAEVGKKIVTARGAVEVDVYATDPTATPPTVYLCECKRWSLAVPQGEVQTFRTVVADAGAHVGLFISARGFQAGAYDVVKHTNLHLVSWAEFQAMFVERWCREYWVPLLRHGAGSLASYVDPVSSDAWVRQAHGEPVEPEEAAGFIVHDMWGPPFVQWGEVGSPESLVPAIWALREKYRQYLPPEVREATSLRELLESLIFVAVDRLRRTSRE
jgi:hypothetical protein